MPEWLGLLIGIVLIVLTGTMIVFTVVVPRALSWTGPTFVVREPRHSLDLLRRASPRTHLGRLGQGALADRSGRAAHPGPPRLYSSADRRIVVQKGLASPCGDASRTTLG